MVLRHVQLTPNTQPVRQIYPASAINQTSELLTTDENVFHSLVGRLPGQFGFLDIQ